MTLFKYPSNYPAFPNALKWSNWNSIGLAYFFCAIPTFSWPVFPAGLFGSTFLMKIPDMAGIQNETVLNGHAYHRHSLMQSLIKVKRPTPKSSTRWKQLSPLAHKTYARLSPERKQVWPSGKSELGFEWADPRGEHFIADHKECLKE